MSDQGEATDDVAEPGDETEVVESPEAEPETVTSLAPPPAPEPRRASPWPLVIGGVVAGGIGYLAATFAAPPPPAPVDTAALTESVSEAGSRLDALTVEIAELRAAPAATPDLSGIESDISGIASRLDEVDLEMASVRDAVAEAAARLDETAQGLSERLTVLETAGPDNAEGAAATEEELAAFRAELERMTAEAEARVAAAQERAAEVEEAAAATAAAAEQAAAEAERQAAEARMIAERDAALVDLKAALESGAGYASVLATIGDVPEVLSANAKDGVPTLLSLQQGFPEAARAALASAETAPQDASAGERFTAFLKRQTNARSLTPKEGAGTDAVLSRAEAMLKQGDLGAALAELDGLGEGPKTAMQDWLTRATTRAAALDAVAQISATIE